MNIEPRPQLHTVLTVQDLDEFREALPESGVFDIFDCRMLVEFSPNTVIHDLEKYITILESCINIVDLDIQPKYGMNSGLRITISEVPLHVAENRNPPARMYKRATPGRPHPSNRLNEYMKDEDDIDLDDDGFDND